MKNLLLLLCSLLLNGVFGDEENKSVKEGDPVTIKIKPEDIKGATDLVLRFNDTNVAKIDLEVKDSQPVYPDERFRDRLNMDRETGSLTITHITSKDSGEYKLEIISKNGTIHKTFRVFVIEELIKVSVMEGDSITLKTGATAKTDDVKWKFNGTDLTDSHHEAKTGDLKITNIRRGQSGEYRVKITVRGSISHKTYSVKISDEVKSVSVMEGDPVTLRTNASRIKTEDVIEWKFKDSLIAHSNNQTSTGRFNINLAGSLIITNIKSEDSGLYDVYITGSKQFHKRFKVTVTGVFGDGENVSVKEGDSVTIKIKPQDINGATDLVLRFNDTNVAKIDLEVKDSQPVYTNERFRDRLSLEHQTGSLTITHITSKDSGEYKLEVISKGGTIYKTFRVFVIEEVKSVSVMEGDSITLKTGATAKTDDVKWKLNGTDLTC